MVPDVAWGAAILTHPDPRQGGNMRSMVPGELIKTLPAMGVATLRFNFRGVGQSTGGFADGIGEQLDIRAAIDQMSAITEGLPLALCGSSFGADTALCVADDRLAGWCAMAPPLREKKLDRMMAVAADPRPKLLVIAERDNFRGPDSVRAVAQTWNNTSIEVVGGADHFFIGRIHEVLDACHAFVGSLRSG